jgi:SHS2 domain-containing protein
MVAWVPFDFFDHTGDIGVRVTAATATELFSEAARALTETLTDLSRVDARLASTLALSSAELDLLLVDWLNELLFQFETGGLLVRRADVDLSSAQGQHRLAARLEADRFDPARHPIKVLVKAVTYHALEVVQVGKEWRATLVFDI